MNRTGDGDKRDNNRVWAGKPYVHVAHTHGHHRKFAVEDVGELTTFGPSDGPTEGA